MLVCVRVCVLCGECCGGSCGFRKVSCRLDSGLVGTLLFVLFGDGAVCWLRELLVDGAVFWLQELLVDGAVFCSWGLLAGGAVFCSWGLLVGGAVFCSCEAIGGFSLASIGCTSCARASCCCWRCREPGML